MKQLSVLFAVAFFSLGLLSMNTAHANPPNLQFPGGQDALMAYIQDNIYYPADAREEGVEGDVMVSFHVSIDGSISRVYILEGVCPSCEEAVLQAFRSMPNWEFVDPHQPRTSCRMQMKVTFELL